MIVTAPALHTPQRSMTATFLNSVANTPDVRRWLGGTGAIDMTPALADPRNIAVECASGGFVALQLGEGRYEIHSLFLPDKAACEAIALMRQGLDYLFAATEARELVTKVPVKNRAAAGLARLAGFAKLFDLPIKWDGDGDQLVAFHTLTLEKWAMQSAQALSAGTWAHDAMEQAKAEGQSSLGAHSAEADAHLRMAGVAMLMLQAGQPRKAERVYNAWADWTGYPRITVLRDHPIVIDLEGIVIEARGNDMEILSCR